MYFAKNDLWRVPYFPEYFRAVAIGPSSLEYRSGLITLILESKW